MPTLLPMVAGGCLLLWIVWKKYALQGDPQKVGWPVAITILLELLLSAHSLYYDCVPLAVAAALTLPEGAPRSKKGHVLFRFWAAILMAYPLLSWLKAFFPLEVIRGIPFFVVNLILLILAGLLYMEALKDRAGNDPARSE